jgi:hypothetical protein
MSIIRAGVAGIIFKRTDKGREEGGEKWAVPACFRAGLAKKTAWDYPGGS